MAFRASTLRLMAVTLTLGPHVIIRDSVENQRASITMDNTFRHFDGSDKKRDLHKEVKEIKRDMEANFRITNQALKAMQTTLNEQNTRLDKVEATQTEQGQKLDLILQLLQQYLKP